MTFSDRDKKILLVVMPLILVGAFLFLVMKPKREEAVQATAALEKQREKLDVAMAREQELSSAKQTFAIDYATVVRLGKAVPTDVDMPSVLVQLEGAARGTGISFGKIVPGARIPAAGGAPAAGGSDSGSGSGGSSSSAAPVAAGGESAQSSSGQTVEKANDTAAGENQSAASSSSTSAETGTQTSTSAKPGGIPVGGAAGGSSAGAGTDGPSAVAGLDTVPLELSFSGSFFDLADFFNRLKRFVRVSNEQVAVRGRLMTIDSFSFSSDTTFPKIEAEMKARIFLTPAQQGATAGASPTEPDSATASGGTAASSPDSSTPTAAAAPSGTGP
jgi:Tfp pilus assembly protein PilO